MRVIKFRAWLKDSALEGLNKSHFTMNGRLYEVEWMNFEGGLVSVRTPSELEFKLNDVDLMQFTGLLDKNGKEIYEGDIVCILNGHHGDVYKIQWQKEFCCWEAEDVHLKDFYFGEQFPSIKEVEVIGNIYENPELLGGVS